MSKRLKQDSESIRTDDDYSEQRRDSIRWKIIESAFKNRILTGAVINVIHVIPCEFLRCAKNMITDQVTQLLNEHLSLKVNFVLEMEFMVHDQVSVKNFNTRNFELFRLTNLDNWYEKDVTPALLAQIEEYQGSGSGWTLLKILHVMVNMNKYKPMRAGCSVSMPKAVRLKRAVVNVISEDEACFFWAVVARLRPAKRNGHRSSSYPHYSRVLRTEGFALPFSLADIRNFEEANDISVNVYEWTGESCNPFYLNERVRKRHVNLLFVQDEETSHNHFAWIKNLSRLVSSQLSKHDHQKYICDRCLQYFTSQERLDTHSVDCGEINKCALKLPTKDNKWLRFKHYAYKEQAPFVIYADLECLLEKLEGSDEAYGKYQRHRPFSVGYYVHCRYDSSLCKYSAYRDEEDCGSWFVIQLKELSSKLQLEFDQEKEMTPLTDTQTSNFHTATHCHVCEKPFGVDDERVRDHCHFTGVYRGPAHKDCNLNYRSSYVIPVIFHNLSGYDAHFIIEKLTKEAKNNINVIPLTKERYISFTISFTENVDKWNKCIKFRFIDSTKFLNSSLDKLSSYLDKRDLHIVRSHYSHLSDDDFDLVTRKAIFPYDYVTSYDKLSDTCLLPREEFYNKLHDSEISDADYHHARRVCSRFGIQTLGQYSDLYLKLDILLLADVFEKFRKDSLENYKLDPAHYVTLPSFTWDAMLKMTKVELELLTDVDMLLFVERGIRGGLSQCSHRHASANNKYMQNYDEKKPSTYLMYFDVNNLYGWAMSQPLPHSGFRWVDDTDTFDVGSVPIDSSIGYILEVDLEYPQEIHDSHADLPFCPDHDAGTKLSQKKLLATFRAKERYVIHYRYLQQCLAYNLKLKKIHRILQFEQSRWLSRYIELNTRLRASSTTEFSKNLFKLMNNAVYGKTMENVRNRRDVKLVSQWDGRYGAENLIARPNYHSHVVFSEDFVAIELNRMSVMFDKPIYIGMSILDLSKFHLYDFHYSYMKSNFQTRCKILYTDTDSLIYQIDCDDVYETIKRDIDRYDTSNYDENNVYGVPIANKKVVGLMKDEKGGKIITEFVGLRAKMYAIRVQGEDEEKKIKGINKNVTAKCINFDDYLKCLYEDEKKTVINKSIRSRKHEVYTESQAKIALDWKDDKRYICKNLIDTLPWGHYDIP
ncbi:uncharacterized protein LOC144467773 [Augochlora pura]